MVRGLENGRPTGAACSVVRSGQRPNNVAFPAAFADGIVAELSGSLAPASSLRQIGIGVHEQDLDNFPCSSVH
jgi:hypothetical protein